MKRLLSLITLVLCFLLPASAQTPKFKYEFTKFGAPFPSASGKRADTASVAADGKGLIFVLRRSGSAGSRLQPRRQTRELLGNWCIRR
jgi:hypothetical protein